MEEVWFTVSGCGVELADLSTNATEMIELKKKLIDWGDTNTKNLSSCIKEILSNSEDRQSPFIFAFRLISDVRYVLGWQGSPLYRAYDNPQSIGEWAMDQLYRKFPIDGDRPIEVKIFRGQMICKDPRFGPGPGAGSIESKVPRLIPQRDWWRNTSYGFVDGIYLVKLDSPIQCKVLRPEYLIDIWCEAKKETKKVRSKKSRKKGPTGKFKRHMIHTETEIEAMALNLLLKELTFDLN